MKFIKKLLKIGFILVILVVISIVYTGYSHYKEAISEISISEKVDSVKENVSFVPLEEISNDFTDAVVAVEDHRFYEHGAFDFISLIRASLVNLKAKEIKEGGSTLTQQVAKNLYFSNKQQFIRKVAELFVAFDLEKTYSKDEILELYVNIIYYGEGNYGIQKASTYYFGKSPAELNYDEATYLAGLPQSPSVYGANNNLAKRRQVEVMEALTDYRKE
ncbi:biosynthetic peptidoglycan transglycosylase [Oceanobacillus sp. Castelsardo]|uniref:biosynthetic peptidoglycan transglycosylase n=1 Tax=Oceanobacillus sp. Castelsardo TaxID=1851204 RepID=UPI000837AC80|nr:biosynthetic peptidoglycan transglycosylase [Oceanobacillus sp. Castelsardo]